MHIAIVIVGYQNSVDIKRCVTALNSSTYCDFEILICENGGRESFCKLNDALPLSLLGGQKITTILADSNLGYAGGVNLCINKSVHADGWWVLNPDTLADADALFNLVQCMQFRNCDAVGGVQYFPNGKVQSDGGKWRPWLARAVSIGYGRLLESHTDTKNVESQMNYITGASMLVSRNFLKYVGYMREDYFLYCEEVEWCLRAKKLGMRFGFTPDARVLHFQGGVTGSGNSITERPKMPIYLDERNKILVTRDCYRYCLPVAAVAALFFLCGRYLRRGAFKQFWYGVQGWRDGLLNKRGVPKWIN